MERRAGALHAAFGIGIVLKGVDGALEILGAAVPLAVAPARLQEAVAALTRHELSRDPHDLLATHLVRAVGHLSRGGEVFASLYLLSHGVLKVVLVWALLRGRVWAYPAALGVFTAFGAYQVYRWTLTRSLAMVVLTVLDAFVIALTWAEWHRVARERTMAPPVGDGGPRGVTAGATSTDRR